jgi:hypothetical protein
MTCFRPAAHVPAAAVATPAHGGPREHVALAVLDVELGQPAQVLERLDPLGAHLGADAA